MSDIAGTWIEDPEVDKALEELREGFAAGVARRPDVLSPGDLTRDDILRRLRESYPALSNQLESGG